MGWEEQLFDVLDDLERQADAMYAAEREAELADRARAEYQQVTLTARLMASAGQDLVLEVAGIGGVAGTLQRVAAAWCLVRGPAQDWVVRLAAITAVSGASERALPEVAWSPLTRLGFGSALRRLADAGERCVLHGLDGQRHDGTLGRVGADFVEVLSGSPVRVSLVAFAGLSAVQSRD